MLEAAKGPKECRVLTPPAIRRLEDLQLNLPPLLHNLVLAMWRAVAPIVALKDMVTRFEIEILKTATSQASAVVGKPLRAIRLLGRLLETPARRIFTPDVSAILRTTSAAVHCIIVRLVYAIAEYRGRDELEIERWRRVVDLIDQPYLRRPRRLVYYCFEAVEVGSADYVLFPSPA